MKYFMTSLIGVLLFACKTDTGDPDKPEVANRTVLVYMAADNNLYPDALDDVNEMEKAWMDDFDGTLLVYLNPRSSTEASKLYKIKKGSTSKIESEVIKVYGIGENACDPSTLTKVVADARKLAPARGFGLIFWSHGTGWINQSIYLPEPKRSKAIEMFSFGESESQVTNKQMQIYDLAAALPSDLVFDFIAFDACYMASVEVAYQLRKKTKLFMGSSTETFVQGFDYTDVLTDFMSKEANIVSVARKTVDYFMKQSGVYQSSTMSVVNCEKLPAVAAALKDIATDNNSVKLASGIQKFDVNDFINYNLFYDLGDLVNKTWAGSAALARFNAAMNEAVLYAGNTPVLFRQVKVEINSGLTMYAPRASQPNTMNDYRTKYDWASESGMSQMQF